MPEWVTLSFSIPPELGDREEALREVRERIGAVEVEQARIRAESGKRIVGRRGVLRQSWRDSPTSREPRRNLRPRVAARSKWSRLEVRRRNSEFLKAYRMCRVARLGGVPMPLPAA